MEGRSLAAADDTGLSGKFAGVSGKFREPKGDPKEPKGAKGSQREPKVGPKEVFLRYDMLKKHRTCFSEVCEAPQARCSEEQSYFSDMTCSENPEPVFSEVFEAPQARCSGAKYLIIHR